MDLIISFVLVIAMSIYRIFIVGVDNKQEFEIKQADGTTTVISGDIPIGNNLMLMKEHGAFTKILKEFNLIQ